MADSGGADSAPVVIVGAGAAGLMAAVFAARGARAVVVLDSTPDGGRKILISGGGRCNILPARFGPDDFHTDSSRHSLRMILASWPGAAQREFFEREVGIELALEHETGKYFPVSNRARDVRDTLRRLAETRGATFRFNSRVTDLLPPATNAEAWQLLLHDGTAISAARVILATGGRSVPATGSDGAGIEMARRLGHAVNPTYPALAPLTASHGSFAHLSGVSLTATVKATAPAESAEARGGFLFTHRGYSGPAVLNVSHVRDRHPDAARVTADFTAGRREELDRLLRSGGGTVGSVLRRLLPDRLAISLLDRIGVPSDTRIGQLPRERRLAVLEAVTCCDLGVDGSGGYQKAEVTGGGVVLGEVDPRTMESRRTGGLYLCGELLDAFGPIGGFNFAWAWATGRLAGLAQASAPQAA